MNSLRSPWIGAFAVAFVAHLALLAAEATPWDTVTKCLLAPLLIGWVLQQGGPRIIVLALVFCFFCDLFLDLNEAWFLAGMAAFAGAHVCFVAFFVRQGAIAGLKQRPWIAVVLALIAVGVLAWAWSGLESGLRVPVAVYAFLLSTTAATALAVDLRAGIGGLLFLFSDAVIALGIAGRVNDGAVTSLTIMFTYGLALFFLATATVWLAAKTAGFDPTQATDCWPTSETGPGKMSI